MGPEPEVGDPGIYHMVYMSMQFGVRGVYFQIAACLSYD